MSASASASVSASASAPVYVPPLSRVVVIGGHEATFTPPGNGPRTPALQFCINGVVVNITKRLDSDENQAWDNAKTKTIAAHDARSFARTLIPPQMTTQTMRTEIDAFFASNPQA